VVVKIKNAKIADKNADAFEKTIFKERTYTPLLVSGIFLTNFYGAVARCIDVAIALWKCTLGLDQELCFED
jgi:hypothetical protein